MAVPPWNNVWLALYRRAADQKFYWIDDTPVAGGFTWWRPGEPNNHRNIERCAEMFSTGKWNDLPCGYHRRFICKLTSN